MCSNVVMYMFLQSCFKKLSVELWLTVLCIVYPCSRSRGETSSDLVLTLGSNSSKISNAFTLIKSYCGTRGTHSVLKHSRLGAQLRTVRTPYVIIHVVFNHSLFSFYVFHSSVILLSIILQSYFFLSFSWPSLRA